MLYDLLIIKIIITDATIYVGGLDEKVSDTLMWELFVQAGPVGNSKQKLLCYQLYFVP